MCQSPGLGVCVCKKDACFLVHDTEKRVLGGDLLAEKSILVEYVVGDDGVVGLIDDGSEVCGLENRAVCFEKSLVVAEMIWVNLVVVADVREALGTWHISDLLAIDCDCDWLLAVDDL